MEVLSLTKNTACGISETQLCKTYGVGQTPPRNRFLDHDGKLLLLIPLKEKDWGREKESLTSTVQELRIAIFPYKELGLPGKVANTRTGEDLHAMGQDI